MFFNYFTILQIRFFCTKWSYLIYLRILIHKILMTGVIKKCIAIHQFSSASISQIFHRWQLQKSVNWVHPVTCWCKQKCNWKYSTISLSYACYKGRIDIYVATADTEIIIVLRPLNDKKKRIIKRISLTNEFCFYIAKIHGIVN